MPYHRIGFSFGFERSYYTYILIDGPSDLVSEICGKLKEHGITVEHRGECRRRAADGYRYKYYVRVTSTSESDVVEFFDKYYPVITGTDLAKIVEEAADGENRLVQQIDAQKALIDELQCRVDRFDEIIGYLRHLDDSVSQLSGLPGLQSSSTDAATHSDIAMFLSALLPSIELFGPSLDVIQRELLHLKPLLVLLEKIHNCPEDVKGERFEGTDFLELRFNGVGRLYYRRNDGRCQVLVSTKADQKRDKRYLKGL